jgi:endoglucanase
MALSMLRKTWLGLSLLTLACAYRQGPELHHSSHQKAHSSEGSGEVDRECVSPCPLPKASEGNVSSDAAFWRLPYPSPFAAESLAKRPSRIATSGPRFVDEAGQTVVFRGVSIADPDLVEREGHLNAELFRTIREWGANVVRVPVHPAAFRGLGPEAYFNLLDRTVRMASGSDLYVIIDWHSIGNLRTGMFQHPMYDTTKQETFEFWRAVAFRYAGVPTVAFFELFNEPTTQNGRLGTISWPEWRALNEELIDVIRAHKNEAIPLVAGFNWAYELENVVRDPVQRPGVGYVSHPYPMKTQRPFEASWEASFGHVADRYPLIATEIGFALPGSKGAHEPVIDDGRYPDEIVKYLDSKGASWVAWVFHPEWAPQMIEDWTYRPTTSGEAFRRLLLKR